MHPSSILSYYPNYGLLDEIVGNSNYDTINLYIDLKNCLQSLYMEHAIVNIIESSTKSNFVDTSVFNSVIAFLAFHKIYALKRQLKVKVHIFFETGESYYHKNISKRYKISRRIDNLYGLDREKRDLFFQILHKNYMLIEKACNKMPNVKVFRLQNLEADFIPYYLISRDLVCKKDSTAHIVYSNDHDLMQTIQAGDHVYIYQKIPKKKRIVRRNQAMTRELKVDTNIPDEYQILAMAVIGDPGDDVDGIKGIGGKTFLKMFEDLKLLIGDMPTLLNNVMNGSPIFDLTKVPSPNKNISKVIDAELKDKRISDNLKLVSFEIISRNLDDPSNTDIIKKKNVILETLNNSDIAPLESLKTGLQMNRVYITEDELETIYHGH